MIKYLLLLRSGYLIIFRDFFHGTSKTPVHFYASGFVYYISHIKNIDPKGFGGDRKAPDIFPHKYE